MSPGLARAVDRIEAALGLVETEARTAEGIDQICLSLARSYLENALLVIDDSQPKPYVPRVYTDAERAAFAREEEERCPRCGKVGALVGHWTGCPRSDGEPGWAKARRLAREAGEEGDF